MNGEQSLGRAIITSSPPNRELQRLSNRLLNYLAVRRERKHKQPPV